MSDETDKSQKTEEPTPRRLEKAREDGQIAQSKELSHWFVLSAITIILVFIAPDMLKKISHSLKFYLEFSSELPFSSADLTEMISRTLTDIGMALFLPVLLIIVAGLAAGMAQTKLNISTKNIQPKLDKLSPLKGLKKLFGVKALVEFTKNLVKFAIIAFIAFLIMVPVMDEFHLIPELTTIEMLMTIADHTKRLFLAVISVIAVIAVIDYGYQRYTHLRDLRMTKQEVKEEFKDSEGDPHIKQKLRAIRQERAQQRVQQAVPEATVVITNPTHYAIALKYDMEVMEQPEVVAKGMDHLALRIRKIAGEHDIPIIEDPPLARALCGALEVGDQVPVKFYEAVAQVIRYVLGFDQFYTSYDEEEE